MPKRLTLPPPLHSQRGLSLIESLIALIVATLSVMGILGVQMRTLTDTQASVRRAQAIRLIEDLSERLQSSPDALSNLGTYTTSPTTTDNCEAALCAPAKLAAYDIKQWREKVSKTLPSGTQAIVFIPQGGSRQLGVLIGWSENRYSQTGQSFSTAEKTALNAPLVVSATNAAGTAVNCPSGLTCHLQYIQPTQRCTPWSMGGGLYCPN